MCSRNICSTDGGGPLTSTKSLEQTDKSDLDKEKLYRKQLLRDDHELRELQRKLNQDYVSHKQKQQIRVNNHSRECRQKMELEECKEQEKNTQQAIEHEELELEQKRREKAKQLAHSLRLQLAEEDDRRVDEIRKFQEEKALIDAALKKIITEDAEAAKNMQIQTKKTMQEMEAQLNEKWMRNELETQRRKEELELADQQKAEQKRRDNEIMKRRKQATEDLEERKEALSKKLAQIQLERAEEEKIRLELEEERQLAAEERAELEESERQRRVCEQLRAAVQQQLEERAARRQQERQHEEEVRRLLLLQWSKEEQLQRLTAEAQLRRRAELREQACAAIEHRREQQRLEEQQLQRQREQLQLMERQREEMVAEERSRLLHQHAIALDKILNEDITNKLNGNKRGVTDDCSQQNSSTLFKK